MAFSLSPCAEGVRAMSAAYGRAEATLESSVSENGEEKDEQKEDKSGPCLVNSYSLK